MSRYSVFRSMLALSVIASAAACGDDDDPTPTNPITPSGTYASIAKILQDDCGGCHGASSNRGYLVTMDSATLVASGFITPTDPPASLLIFKTRTSSHGGGIVSAFSSIDSTAVTSWISKQPAVGGTVLTAVRTTGTLLPDGQDSEDAWRNAKWLAARIGGGWSDATEVYVKAVYDATNLYMLVKWNDDVASYKRQPFVKQEDGSWLKTAAKPLPQDGTDWAGYMGKAFNEEATAYLYEDKMAIAWNTYGATTSPAFQQSGCAGVCHDPAKNGAPGTGYYYSDQKRAAKKFTNNPSEILDLWHWKLVRQNENAKMDDQYVRHWVIGDAGAGDGGRASDAGTSGYADATHVSGKPVYRGRTLAPGLFAYPRTDTVRFTDAELNALPIGTIIASMWTSPITGQRADLDARGYYNPNLKTWQLEIRRKLVTGDDKDVQFDNLDRTYIFGLAVFDNAQIEHSWSPAVLKLVFQK